MCWEWRLRERGASRRMPRFLARATGRMDLSTEPVKTAASCDECQETLVVYLGDVVRELNIHVWTSEQSGPEKTIWMLSVQREGGYSFAAG